MRLLSVSSQKTDLAAELVAERRFSKSVAAETLDVSRSNLHERAKGSKHPRGRYKKAENAVLFKWFVIWLMNAQPTAIGALRLWSTAKRGRRSVRRQYQANSSDHAQSSAAVILQILLRDGYTYDGKVMVMTWGANSILCLTLIMIIIKICSQVSAFFKLQIELASKGPKGNGAQAFLVTSR